MVRVDLYHEYDPIYGYGDNRMWLTSEKHPENGSLQSLFRPNLNSEIIFENHKLFQKIVLMIKVLFWMFGL